MLSPPHNALLLLTHGTFYSKLRMYFYYTKSFYNIILHQTGKFLHFAINSRVWFLDQNTFVLSYLNINLFYHNINMYFYFSHTHISPQYQHAFLLLTHTHIWLQPSIHNVCESQINVQSYLYIKTTHLYIKTTQGNLKIWPLWAVAF